MRLVVVLAVLFAAFPSAGLAVPPPNDNRADAVAIPSFPSTVSPPLQRRPSSGSTRRCRGAAASSRRCGTGSTLLPTGSSPSRSPGRRERRPSCASTGVLVPRSGDRRASPAPGQSGSATFEAVRGNNYLVLVGRRPRSPTGRSTSRPSSSCRRRTTTGVGARVAPAGAVPGHARRHVGRVRSGVQDGQRLGLVSHDRRSRRARFAANRRPRWLDAAVAVIRVRASCASPGADESSGGRVGHVRGARGGTYLIAIGHEGSDPGRSGSSRCSPRRWRVARRKSAPARRRRSTLHGLTDVNDVWRSRCRPARLSARVLVGTCASVSLRARRNLDRPLRSSTAAASRPSLRARTAPEPTCSRSWRAGRLARSRTGSDSHRRRGRPRCRRLLRNRATTHGSLDPDASTCATSTTSTSSAERTSSWQ